MKTLFLGLVVLALSSFINWQPDFEKAKQIAKQKHELILLNFSGSDWCGPCIRMRKEIFSDASFTALADSNLVLVNADFPRNKKNKLSKTVIKQNESLADKYNPEGKFPFTLLLDENGKVLKTWDGYPDGGISNFMKQVKAVCNGRK